MCVNKYFLLVYHNISGTTIKILILFIKLKLKYIKFFILLYALNLISKTPKKSAFFKKI